MNTVEAVKSIEDVRYIASMLEKHCGTLYSDIWIVGVNSALRISDLLSITMLDALAGVLSIIEGKTGKARTITLNDTAMKIIRKRREENPNHVYLFEVDSNRAKDRPISRFSVAKAFKEVGEMNRVNVKLGTHSMRKTLGWVMHSQGASIERICRLLNHSHPAVTMRYLGLTDADTQAAYSEFELKI